MLNALPLPPLPGSSAGRQALRSLLAERSVLGTLVALRDELGPIFRLPLPGFNAVVVSGPEAARFFFLEAREQISWRLPRDPVVRVLRHGLLIEDGESQAELRRLVTPAYHRRMLASYTQAIWQCTAELAAGWRPGQAVNLLDAMRVLALRVLTVTTFWKDIGPELPALWPAILRTLSYIGPGAWLLWPEMPRPGYGRALRQMDDYLYRLIAARRADGQPGEDVPGLLIAAGLEDGLIRDQLLTLLIAGHDTSTALLAWVLLELGRHPEALARAQAEARALPPGAPSLEVLDQLPYLDRVIKETLRLHPPIHAANRRALQDLSFGGYRIPAGARVLYSIFLTHHDPQHWPDHERFDPDRFTGSPPAPYTYLPFGAGPRFCIGSAFAQVESRLILAYLLRTMDYTLLPPAAHRRMGATLEPHPGVRARLYPR